MKDLELMIGDSRVFGGGSDSWKWKIAGNGSYSSREGYSFLKGSSLEIEVLQGD